MADDDDKDAADPSWKDFGDLAEKRQGHYANAELTLTSRGLVEPDCGAPRVRWCVEGWGRGYWWGPEGLNTGFNDENGNRSGGVSMRVGRQGVFAFADGHVKRMPLTRAAEGTNWTPDVAASDIRVTDRSKYMWDDQ